MKVWHIGVLVALGLLFDLRSPGALGGTFRYATLTLFLPALIFEAAWNLDLPTMRRVWKPIVLLAIPGVALTAAIVAAGAHFVGGVTLPLALLLGAILSATDPVAVVAIFRRLRVPKELATIVESESLLNDAVAVVVYRAILSVVVATAAAASGATAAGTAAVAGFALVGSLLGIAVGVAVGIVAAQALRLHGNLVVHTLATLIAAYGSYALAERFDWSGIFAVVACGIAMRESGRRDDDVKTAHGVERVWSWLATAANAVLFFLIGAAVAIPDLKHDWRALAATLAAVLVARVALAYGLLALAPGMIRTWKTVVRLAGVRGALSLALALAIPYGLHGRALTVDATFVVVVATLLLGTFTIRSRIDRMDLGPD